MHIFVNIKLYKIKGKILFNLLFLTVAIINKSHFYVGLNAWIEKCNFIFITAYEQALVNDFAGACSYI